MSTGAWSFPAWRKLSGAPPLKHSAAQYILLGMRRSGHHAVRDWLVAHYPGEVVSHGFGNERDWFIARDGVVRDCYIFNAENIDPLSVAECLDTDAWLSGTTRETVPKLGVVLRDPYNTLAGVLKFWGPGRSTGVVETWAKYAREYTEGPRFLPARCVWVLYNRWFLESEYRLELEGRFGLPKLGVPIPDVQSHIGSSFERDVAPRDLQVEDRWKHFASDREFLGRFQDREVNRMAIQIFGDVARVVCKELELPS